MLYMLIWRAKHQTNRHIYTMMCEGFRVPAHRHSTNLLPKRAQERRAARTNSRVQNLYISCGLCASKWVNQEGPQLCMCVYMFIYVRHVYSCKVCLAAPKIYANTMMLHARRVSVMDDALWAARCRCEGMIGLCI